MLWYLLWRVILFGEINLVVSIGAGSMLLITDKNQETTVWWISTVMLFIVLFLADRRVKPMADRKYLLS